MIGMNKESLGETGMLDETDLLDETDVYAETSESILTDILVPAQPEVEKKGLSRVGILIGIGVFALLVIAAVVVWFSRKKKPAALVENVDGSTDLYENDIPMAMQGNKIGVGKLHNVGKRSGQQDCLGVTDVGDGVFAVVADGMGGLADGDKVSQSVVMTMLSDAVQQKGLADMVAHANREVNRMLGLGGQYKSGSTVVAVLATPTQFQWISVGDSRIYLYRNGRMIQLNREHVYEADLIKKAVNGEMTMDEVMRDPQRHKLTSFIGMGTLKYIDASLRPVAIQSGDCLLLMSDGVFNTLSEEEMATILTQYPDPEHAASVMEERVLSYEKAKQDNFTAILLKF